MQKRKGGGQGHTRDQGLGPSESGAGALLGSVLFIPGAPAQAPVRAPLCPSWLPTPQDSWVGVSHHLGLGDLLGDWSQGSF